MNKTKFFKALGLAMCAILLVVGSVAGTFAYLTSKTDTVKNTFTAGNVKITLDEAVVNEYGAYKTDATNRDVKNDYKLIPGHTYIKDPTIHVDANSEDCWLFAKIENGLGNEATLAMVAGWKNITGTDFYYYETKATAEDDVAIFTTFTLGNEADVGNLDGKTIMITAYAIQADNFDSALDAWDVAPAEWTGNNGN